MAMALADRPTDEPPLADGPTGHSTDVRARLLYDCFATPNSQLETTLPPDDPDAGVARGSVTFVWPTQYGGQPVIMPLWRRLD
jgi:hypothetical protein